MIERTGNLLDGPLFIPESECATVAKLEIVVDTIFTLLIVDSSEGELEVDFEMGSQTGLEDEGRERLAQKSGCS